MLDKFKSLTKGVAGKASSGLSGGISGIKTARLKRKSSEDYLVALDIGTEYVKTLIGRVVGNGVEIIGVGRAHQSLSDMQAGAIADIASVVDNCDKALAQAEEQAGVSARSAVIGIAGELVKGTTKAVKFTRTNPNKPMDIAEVEQIIKLVQQRAEASAKESLALELGGKDVEVRLVNSALVSIDIDGYKVTNPIGFQGKEVLVQLYTAFAPLIHIGALERTAQELDLDLLAVAAEPFAVARSVIGDDPNATMSAILMDVGGGTTDIALIDEGGVQGTIMFGIGGRAYTRAIEREMGTNFSVAEDLKIGLSNKTLPPNKVPVVEQALRKTLDVWASGVELALSEFTAVDNLPHRVLLCGGGSSLEMLMDELHTSTWYRQLPFTKRPQVEYINPKEVVGIIDTTGDAKDHTFITAMGLLRVGLDTMLQANSTPTNSVREKLDRMLRV